MREFEKWRDKQEISNLSGRSYKADARVWRAALEWAKAMHDVSSEPRFAMNIEEELKS